jgi:hypothetical protein
MQNIDVEQSHQALVTTAAPFTSRLILAAPTLIARSLSLEVSHQDTKTIIQASQVLTAPMA